MEIEVVNFKRCDIVKAKGRIDSSTATQLLDQFNALLDNGRYRLILNLEDVTFISSAGLRVLITVQKLCRRYNRGELVLTCIPENIMAAIDLAGFEPLFKIFASDVEAVGNF